MITIARQKPRLKFLLFSSSWFSLALCRWPSPSRWRSSPTLQPRRSTTTRWRASLARPSWESSPSRWSLTNLWIALHPNLAGTGHWRCCLQVDLHRRHGRLPSHGRPPACLGNFFYTKAGFQIFVQVIMDPVPEVELPAMVDYTPEVGVVISLCLLISQFAGGSCQG